MVALTSISQLVVREVHRPDLVQGHGHRERLGILPIQALLRCDARVQGKLPVDAVRPLVVARQAPDVAQIQATRAKALVALIVGQSDEPAGDLTVLN